MLKVPGELIQSDKQKEASEDELSVNIPRAKINFPESTFRRFKQSNA